MKATKHIGSGFRVQDVRSWLRAKGLGFRAQRFFPGVAQSGVAQRPLSCGPLFPWSSDLCQVLQMSE